MTEQRLTLRIYYLAQKLILLTTMPSKDGDTDADIQFLTRLQERLKASEILDFACLNNLAVN